MHPSHKAAWCGAFAAAWAPLRYSNTLLTLVMFHVQAVNAFKRVAQREPARYLQPLHTFQDSTALINALGQEEYYEYEEEVEPAPPEPKYINGKRVLVNLEIE